MTKIVLTEEDLKSIVKNNLHFKKLKFSPENFNELITGKVVTINDSQIILQDIGTEKILKIILEYFI
jgi:hypothetical protein